MARIRTRTKTVTSIFRYEVIPLAKVNYNKPVVVIQEYNEGNFIIMEKNRQTSKLDLMQYDGSTDMIDAKEYPSLRAFLLTEIDCGSFSDMDLNPVSEVNVRKAMEELYGNENPLLSYGGVLKIHKLTGAYCDIEQLYKS